MHDSFHVFDAMNTPDSVRYLSQVMGGEGCRCTCTTIVQGDRSQGMDVAMEGMLERSGVKYQFTFVGDVHEQVRPGQAMYEKKSGGRLFGSIISLVLQKALEGGHFAGHPYAFVKGGLEGVQGALHELKNRTWSGNKKLVTSIADTPGTFPADSLGF